MPPAGLLPPDEQELSGGKGPIASDFRRAHELVFLSLSFDSDFDQPKVLQGHAPIYRGSDASGWWFAALGPSGVAAVKSAFDLMIGREAGGFSHNLRTVVVDPQGKLAHQFNGNRWTAEELAAAMVAAANQGRSTP